MYSYPMTALYIMAKAKGGETPADVLKKQVNEDYYSNKLEDELIEIDVIERCIIIQ